MENGDTRSQDAEPKIGNLAPGERTRPLRAITQNKPLDHMPIGSTFLPSQRQNTNDISFTEAEVQINEDNEVTKQYPRAGNTHRLQEAQAAFSANSAVIVTAPLRAVWTGNNSLSVPQNTQTLTEKHQDQEWTPRLTLGSIDVGRVGAKEAARRHVLQWDKIYEFNEIQNPGSLQTVDKHRAEARGVYEELLASERSEDSVPMNDLASYQNERIQARTALLWKTLLETPQEGCEPMKTNVTAALKGYNTGMIGFSGHYTLIYAGHIVDTMCATYSAFTCDRGERLDRYLEEYGPGYLWWEPPLAKGKERVLAKKSAVLNLDREDGDPGLEHQQAQTLQDDTCHYKVPLGFKRDDSMRYRLGSQRKRSVVAKGTRPDSVTAGKRKREKTAKAHQDSNKSKCEKLTARVETSGSQGVARAGKDSAVAKARDTESDTPSHKALDDAPTIFFDMLLDSGAELPVLLHDDFELLGYSKQDMNAASVVELSAAAGQTSTALCFELRVGLELQGSPSASWIDQVAYSEARFYLCRVIKLPATVKAPAHGAFSADRLSGMLPFLAYYMASAPGNGRLCLGEKRAEVLTTQNLPAELKYDPFRNPLLASGSQARRQEQVAKIRKLGGQTRGLRRVTLETEMTDGRRLVDEDVIDEGSQDIRSNIGIINKHGDLIHVWNQGGDES